MSAAGEGRMGDKVSIIIPVYNQAEFLEQAIQSALGQTYGEREVIIIDDGSTDDSLQVAGVYYRQIKLVHQENRHQAAARNTGAKWATGDILLFLDADDWVERTFLEKTVPFMDIPETGIVATDMQYFGASDLRIAPRGTTLAIEKESNELPCCSLVRRRAFEDAGGYNESPAIHGMEDWNLWISILERGWRVAVLNEPLFHYRVHAGSTCGQVASRRADVVAAVKALHP